MLLKIFSALLEHDKLGTGNVQFGSAQFNILLRHLQIFPQGQETSNYIRIEPIRTRN